MKRHSVVELFAHIEAPTDILTASIMATGDDNQDAKNLLKLLSAATQSLLKANGIVLLELRLRDPDLKRAPLYKAARSITAGPNVCAEIVRFVEERMNTNNLLPFDAMPPKWREWLMPWIAANSLSVGTKAEIFGFRELAVIPVLSARSASRRSETAATIQSRVCETPRGQGGNPKSKI